MLNALEQRAKDAAKELSVLGADTIKFRLGLMTPDLLRLVEDILINDYPKLNHARIFPAYEPNKMILRLLDEILANEDKFTSKQYAYMKDLRKQIETGPLPSYQEKVICQIHNQRLGIAKND